ncbi:MAG TPA: hypothetical protein VFB21_08785, partial [Chthonomonadaceae bacterium]|nr:hypothetical protein [Chthonomonadaceae bacterium]
ASDKALFSHAAAQIPVLLRARPHAESMEQPGVEKQRRVVPRRRAIREDRFPAIANAVLDKEADHEN